MSRYGGSRSAAAVSRDVSLDRFAILGAVAGLVLGGIAMAKGIELTLPTGKIFDITTALGIIGSHRISGVFPTRRAVVGFRSHRLMPPSVLFLGEYLETMPI